MNPPGGSAMSEVPGAAMRAEIGLQPEYVRRLAQEPPCVPDAGLQGRRPVLTGCGTSFFAAGLAAAHLAEAGSPLPAVQAFELLRAPRLDAHGDLLVALSHFGDTPAVLDLLERAQAEGIRTVLVTGFPDSPSTRLADRVIATGYAEERSWCHTISFTLASLATLRFLHSLGGFPPPPDLVAVAAAMDRVLQREADIARLASPVADASSVWLLGAGPTEPLAAEFGLKLCEAAYIPAQPLELEQFFHGYIPAVERDAAVIAALPPHVRTRADDLRRVAEVVGFRLVDAGAFAAGTPAQALPWAQATALQLLTYHVAMQRGTDPDRLRREDPVYRRARDVYR